METVAGCRLRVHEFEKELARSLDGLSSLDESILNMSKLRKAWLDSVSRVDDIEAVSVSKKLELLRIRADNYLLQLSIDSIRLDGFYEAQQLKHMVMATSPLEEGDTNQSRSSKLNKLAREGVEEIKMALKESIEFRMKLALMCDALVRELKATLTYYEERQTTAVDDLKLRILQYVDKLEKACAQSKKHFKDITTDYLVLRHNARVSKEILIKKQNESSAARETLQKRMEQLLHDANHQRIRMEESANDELRVLTNDVRSEVMKNELELRNHIREANEKKQIQKITNAGIKKLIRKYEEKFVIFNDARKIEILEIQKEIKALRELMRSVKKQYVHKNSLNKNKNCHNNINIDCEGSNIDFKQLDRATLLNLSKQMNIEAIRPPQPPGSSISSGHDICI